MIILEGIRRSGKTFTMDVLKENFKNMQVYKDVSMRIINHQSINADAVAMGRDFAYAQFIPQILSKSLSDHIIFDRGYWSSYVYAQCWRDEFTKEQMTEHVQKVEEQYGNFMDNIKIVFIKVDAVDIERIEAMDRGKDRWEKTHSDYREQYSLYTELPMISKANVYEMKAFQDEEYIVNKFKDILRS